MESNNCKNITREAKDMFLNQSKHLGQTMRNIKRLYAENKMLWDWLDRLAWTNSKEVEDKVWEEYREYRDLGK